MKVNKVALLEATNTALATLDKQERDYIAATEIWRNREAKKWIAQKQPQWRALRDLLTRSIKDSKPVTDAQITALFGRSSYITDHTYSAKAAPPDPIVLPDGTRVPKPRLETVTIRPGYGRPRRSLDPPVTGRSELKALKLFLEGSPDEAFTLESLSRLGFKAPAAVFRAAVT